MLTFRHGRNHGAASLQPLLSPLLVYAGIALGAIGARGPEHAMTVLQDELRSTLGQLGCASIRQLPEFLIRDD